MTKATISKNANKLRKWVIRHKSLVMWIAVLFLFILTPPLVNLLVNTPAFILPGFFGFVTADSKDAWIGFFGALIGGGITLAGVAWTIIDQSRKRQEDAKDAVKPIVISGVCTYAEIKGIRNDRSGAKVFECILPYKNVGKGILYNPSIYDFDCSIDTVPVENARPNIPILSCVDIGQQVDIDIQAVMSPAVLQQFFERLENRGNTLKLSMALHVGGNDMYGRNIVTRLKYTIDVVWGAPTEIELGISKGALTSEVLFDDGEISEIVASRNPRYRIC